jgi:ABC-type phosphate transport system substrate-binding protein
LTIRKGLIVLITLFLLTSCKSNSPELPELPPEPAITTPATPALPPESEPPPVEEADLERVKAYLNENFNRFTIDGSTSMIPLHQSLRNKFGERYEVWHNRTVWAFEQFINGDIDILLSVDFSDELLQKAETGGVKLAKLPITREAFVFLVNRHNPVQNLTSEQIRAIYSGEITNWSQLGGDDAPITAFQRNADSGSQIRMNKFMGDIPLMEAASEFVEGIMGGIVERIANFDEGRYSIAYNMYTFTEKQYTNEDVILLAVDGVLPTDESIFNNTYPVVIYNYIYYDENNTEAAEFALNLCTYLMSGEGQRLISDSGYVNLNQNFDRNMNAEPSWFPDESEIGYVRFHNEETGEFYAVGGQGGGLLVFNNYADYILGVGGGSAEAREFLTVIQNSDLRLSQFTARIWTFEDGVSRIIIDPISSFVWDPVQSFNFKYSGRYFAQLSFNLDENQVELKAVVWDYFEEFAESYTNLGLDEYIGLVSQEQTVVLSLENLKNLYVNSGGWGGFNEETGQAILEYFQPFIGNYETQ